MKSTVIFFGSFQHYSTKVLKALHENKNIDVLAVITTPPATLKTGGKKIIKKTHVNQYAEKASLTVIAPKKLDKNSLKQLGQLEIRSIRNSSQRPDFFVVAGYGMKLSKSWLEYPAVAPLNLHFSLLPKYRGANPAEWAILMGEHETGVTLMKMDTGIDTGPILTQQKLPINLPTMQGVSSNGGDTRETLYEHLYQLSADILPEILIRYQRCHKNSAKPSEASRLAKRPNRQSAQSNVAQEGEKLYLSPRPQPKSSPTPYARLLKRPDGFIPWPVLQQSMQGEKTSVSQLPPLLKQVQKLSKRDSKIYDPKSTISILERAIRALYGFPGVWTEVQTTKGKKRLKIISAHLKNDKLILDQVQVEGKKTSSFNQVKKSLL